MLCKLLLNKLNVKIINEIINDGKIIKWNVDIICVWLFDNNVLKFWVLL